MDRPGEELWAAPVWWGGGAPSLLHRIISWGLGWQGTTLRDRQRTDPILGRCDVGYRNLPHQSKVERSRT
jgi:hypothetical protein